MNPAATSWPNPLGNFLHRAARLHRMIIHLTVGLNKPVLLLDQQPGILLFPMQLDQRESALEFLPVENELQTAAVQAFAQDPFALAPVFGIERVISAFIPEHHGAGPVVAWWDGP